MTITNGYASLTEFKAYAEIVSTNSGDDTMLEDIIEAASRYIDKITSRTFYGVTATRLFDLPAGPVLYLDEDLITVTTLTNGDGSTIAAANYWLHPLNTSPKYAIQLKQSTSLSWLPSSAGDSVGCISVAGTWGYSATAPDNIKLACLLIANSYRQQRSGMGVQSATVTPGGIVIQDAEIPRPAWAIIRDYRKVAP